MSGEIRQRSFGEILDGAFRVLSERFTALLALGAVVYLPSGLLAIALLPQSGMMSIGAPGPFEAFLPALGLHTVLSVLIVAVTWPIASAAITHTVFEHYHGRVAGIAAALRVGWRIYMPLVGTSMLCWLAVLLGLILVVPGVWLALGFLVIGQVMVVEGAFGVAAMRRSRELMRGHLLRGFGLIAVSTAFALVLPATIQMALATLPVVGYVASAFVHAAGLAYSIAVSVLLYLDLRCRKESYDLQQLATVVAARGTSG